MNEINGNVFGLRINWKVFVWMCACIGEIINENAILIMWKKKDKRNGNQIYQARIP